MITYLTSGAISNTTPFLTTAGVNSKFSAALISSLQIFTGVMSSKEKYGRWNTFEESLS